MNDVEARVKKSIRSCLGMGPEEPIDNGAKFDEDLGADSLDRVEIAWDLGDEFEIDVPDETAEQLVTVQDAINYINGRADAR